MTTAGRLSSPCGSRGVFYLSTHYKKPLNTFMTTCNTFITLLASPASSLLCCDEQQPMTKRCRLVWSAEPLPATGTEAWFFSSPFVGLPAKSLSFQQAVTPGWLPVLIEASGEGDLYSFEDGLVEACCHQQLGLAPMLQLSLACSGAQNRWAVCMM